MSKIGKVNYRHLNWGPFVLGMKMPDYIVKKLLTEGKKAKHNYNTGNVPMSQPDNSIHIPNADTVSQLLPNCKPDLSKIRYNNIKSRKNNQFIE